MINKTRKPTLSSDNTMAECLMGFLRIFSNN